MKSKFPVRRLVWFNLWVASFFSVFGFFSTIANLHESSIQSALVVAMLALIIMLCIAFSNLGLLVLLESNRIEIKGRKAKSTFRTRFVLISYLINITEFLIIIYVFSYVSNQELRFDKFVYICIIGILVNTLILMLQGSVILNYRKVRSDLEISELKAANADVANQLLRQQIHPHFLFNALNILKSLYKTQPKDGEKYLIHLSDFLRTSISANNMKIILIKDEVKLCTDYLEMQRIRFDEELTYHFAISNEAMNSGRVPSFSIQPLIENAIKHNKLTEEDPLHITIEQIDNRIAVSNKIIPKKSTAEVSGTGLLNLSKRYQLIANEDIVIKQENNIFSVSIMIIDWGGEENVPNNEISKI